MKKNLTALLLALTLALSLAACGGSSGGESKSADLTAFYETLASDETLPAMMLLE